MTTEITHQRQRQTPEEVTRITASWPDLLRQPIATQREATQLSRQVTELTTPASRKWISGRVATLLSHYFVSSVPSDVMAAMAEDWINELKTLPPWAIQKACRWWMSNDNPERRKKPLPGDIAAQARRELGPVACAEVALKRFERANAPVRAAQQPTPSKNQSPSAESKARVAEMVKGFAAGKRVN